MKTNVFDLGVFRISLPEGWCELAADTGDLESPTTIANAEAGVGALQISIARYKRGSLPHVSSNDLAELLDDFAASRGLFNPFDQQVLSNGKMMIGRSFRSDSDFVRVWYASNGKDILLLTYVCEWSVKDAEAIERDAIVKSVSFHDAL